MPGSTIPPISTLSLLESASILTTFQVASFALTKGRFALAHVPFQWGRHGGRDSRGHRLHSLCTQVSESHECLHQVSIFLFIQPGLQPPHSGSSSHFNQCNLESPSPTATLCGCGCLGRGTLVLSCMCRPAGNLRLFLRSFPACCFHLMWGVGWNTCMGACVWGGIRVWVHVNVGIHTCRCLRVTARITLSCSSTFCKKVEFCNQTQSLTLW